VRAFTFLGGALRPLAAEAQAQAREFETQEAQQRWPVSLRFLAACSGAPQCWSKN
jgi:hypothetical protein